VNLWGGTELKELCIIKIFCASFTFRDTYHMLIISSCRQNKNGLCLHGISIYNYFYCSLFSLLVFCGVYINSLSLIFSIIIGLIFYGVTYFISSKEKDMVLYIIRRNLDMEET